LVLFTLVASKTIDAGLAQVVGLRKLKLLDLGRIRTMVKKPPFDP
jgi:hypothetical protein